MHGKDWGGRCCHPGVSLEEAMQRNSHPGRLSRPGILALASTSWCAVWVASILSSCGGGGGATGFSGASQSYNVEGTVSGMFGAGLVLRNNGGDDLSISANGNFTFQTKVHSGSAYQVTIQAQPSGPVQTCSVTNASGTVGGAPVTNVDVTCGPIALIAGALGGPGSLDGIGNGARFSFPSGIARDLSGNLYIADRLNDTIRKITP